MKHEIEIVALPGGELQSTVTGVEGPSCEGLSAWIEELGEVIEHKSTADAKKTPKVKVGGKVGRG